MILYLSLWFSVHENVAAVEGRIGSSLRGAVTEAAWTGVSTSCRGGEKETVFPSLTATRQ